MTQPVSTDAAAAPVAAYSQAVRAGDLVFVSGQIPLDPTTGALISDAIGAATRQSLANVARILESAGGALNHVVKATVFLIDPADYAGMDAAYREVMPEPFPRAGGGVRSGVTERCSGRDFCHCPLARLNHVLE